MSVLRPVVSDPSQPLGRVAESGCDAAEKGVLSIIRHLTIANQQPESGAWAFAFTIATERFGDHDGMALAGAASDLVQALLALPGPGLVVQDPLDLDARGRLTAQEAALMRMLRAMRQDLTPLAREELATLTGGRMVPAVITAALRLARLLPPLRAGSVWHPSHPGLRLVQ